MRTTAHLRPAYRAARHAMPPARAALATPGPDRQARRERPTSPHRARAAVWWPLVALSALLTLALAALTPSGDRASLYAAGAALLALSATMRSHVVRARRAPRRPSRHLVEPPEDR